MGGMALISGFAGCASSADDRTETAKKTPTPTPEPVQIVYDLQLKGDHILVTLQIDASGNHDQLTVELSSDHHVTTVEGFEEKNPQSYQTTRPNGSPSIQYQIFAGKNERGQVWIGDGWAVTFPITIRAKTTSAPADTQFAIRDSGIITDGNPIAILGDYVTDTVSAKTGESFKVFAANQPQSYTEPIIPVLRHSSELLQWNNYVDSTVRFVIVPSAGGMRGSPYGGGNITIWGAGRSSDWGFLSTLVHEYLHLREPPGSGDMHWINEAVPDYYAGLLLYEQDVIDERIFRGYITPRIDKDIALTEASGEDYRYRYTKGRRVLGALDGEIRLRTDGSHTLQQVFARSVASGAGDLNSFKRITEGLTSHSFDSWIDKYVTTTATPDVPDVDMSMLAPETSSDADDDGSTDRSKIDNEPSSVLPNNKG